MAYLQMRDGTQLYYEDTGSGQPVIMAHGWKASAALYHSTAAQLQDSYRCIRYDQRGHMRSSVPVVLPTMDALAEDLEQLIQALCPQHPPVLIGHSMGGLALLNYIRKFGCCKIKGVIIVDIAPYPLFWKRNPDGTPFTREDLKQDLEMMRSDFNAFLRSYYIRTNPGYADLPQQDQDAIITKRMTGQHPQVLAALWESLILLDCREALSSIRVPAAIFHAGIKPACRPEAAEFYQSAIPGRVDDVLFPQGSHALITELPKEFCTEVRKFLQSL